MKISAYVTRLALALGLFLGAAAALAHADTIWDWSLTTAIGDGSGTLTTSSSGVDASLTVTSISGTFDGYAITGLSSSFQFPDNTVEWNGTPASSFILDVYGLSFTTTQGTFNVDYDAPGYGAAGDIAEYLPPFSPARTVSASSLTPAVAPIPEPSTIFLLAGGLSGLLAMRLRRTGTPLKQAV